AASHEGVKSTGGVPFSATMATTEIPDGVEASGGRGLEEACAISTTPICGKDGRRCDVSDQQSSVELVASIYEAFTRGDIPAILNCLDPDAELIFEGSPAIPWAGNRRGHDGWLSFFQAVGNSLDDVTFAETMRPFAVQDDRMVFSGRYVARVKSTGKRIDSPLVHLW